MKKLIFAIVFGLVMTSCGNNLVNGHTDECHYQQVDEKETIISELNIPIVLYESKTLIYKDNALRYIESENKDSVVKTIAENFSPIEVKDTYTVNNVDTTYNNISWYDIQNNRFFFNNETREIVMMVELEFNGIIDKEMLRKYYSNVPNIIDECIKVFH